MSFILFVFHNGTATTAALAIVQTVIVVNQIPIVLNLMFFLALILLVGDEDSISRYSSFHMGRKT